jgi:phosphopantothenoylcysteine decarboxylase
MMMGLKKKRATSNKYENYGMECAPPYSIFLQEQKKKMKEEEKVNEQMRTTSTLEDQMYYKVLICITGSVASIKLEELISCLLCSNHVIVDHSQQLRPIVIKVIMTQMATHFVHVNQLKQNYPNVTFYTDADEWSVWKQKGDPVTHIELRKWADLLLIAPLDANTLAKIANGICDNLVTCVCRAWDIGKRPWLVAPAMNTLMWNHPFTSKQLDILRNDLKVQVIDPISKLLACGDQGLGAMASVTSIVDAVLEHRDRSK